MLEIHVSGGFELDYRAVNIYRYILKEGSTARELWQSQLLHTSSTRTYPRTAQCSLHPRAAAPAKARARRKKKFPAKQSVLCQQQRWLCQKFAPLIFILRLNLIAGFLLYFFCQRNFEAATTLYFSLRSSRLDWVALEKREQYYLELSLLHSGIAGLFL